MLEESSMEKKNTIRGVQVAAKPLPLDSKTKDVVGVARFPRNGKRREGPVPKSDPPSRPWNPKQRYDKRIQGRSDSFTAGDRHRNQVAGVDDAEVASVTWAGSKKLSLNHLLNFKYDRRDGGRLSSSSWGAGGGNLGNGNRNRGIWVTRKHKYNKEQFLQANCQFVVQAGQDYSVYFADPDLLVDWGCIEQVCVLSRELPSCPICLYPPVAAKMTRCGHIYCWPCILHYLSLSDKTWRKCPICYEAVHKADLKSAVTSTIPCFAVGDEITMQLMQRERGSVVALPKQRWKKTDGNPFHVNDGTDGRFAKLLVATKEEVLSGILDREEHELMMASAENEGCPEICFIEFALEHLGERKKSLQPENQILAEFTENVVVLDKEITVSVKVPDSLKPVTYTSAFNDEEVDVTVEEAGDISFMDVTTLADDHQNAAGSVDNNITDNGSDVLAQLERLEIAGIEVASELPVDDKTPKKDVFYFYQAADGQHIYLHAVNVHMLIREYGSLERCPDTITGVIVEKEGISMNEELRHRLRYLGHLPLICEFEVVELCLRPPIVSQETIDAFAEELEKRRRRRSHRARVEHRRERHLQAEENRKLGKIVVPPANLRLDSMRQFPECGPKLVSDLGTDGIMTMESAVVCEETQSTCSSPSSSFGPGSPENTSSSPSFAQMLCRRKAPSQTNWPKHASGLDTVSEAAVRGYGSDSEGEDSLAPPSFRDSFGAALQDALDRSVVASHEETNVNNEGCSKKKKGKQKRLLFTTTVIRSK